MDPIAIVGIGCRFPRADGPDAFWQLVRDGGDAITEVPADRWNAAALHSDDPRAPGRMTTRWGGFIDGIDRFDAGFFGITPREAPFVDPQQRLLLEAAWEAFEDAGIPPDRLAGTATGVYVGIGTHDYSLIGWSDHRAIGAYTGAGTSASIAANRVSYVLDLRGPSMAIDTACSSSLVAVHLACQGLWNDEATLAVAGGVNAILLPVGTIGLSKAGAMAPDGRCKVFDARADGYVRSEGVGTVVLKRLSQATADGDRVYATILGSATNTDGRTNGLMAPNRWAQEAVIREAWRRAGASPGDAQYVEAHGTGTLLGDPIEAKALGSVLNSGRQDGLRCLIGSVKANVGHLEAAAGIAGLIKLALMIRHRTIPPSVHFERPNPHIPFATLPLRVATSAEPWPEPGPVLAGVSSFGFGGANAHIVMSAPPLSAARLPPTQSEMAQTHVLPVSARSHGALRDLVARYLDQLGVQASRRLVEVCHTAGVRRTHHAHRAAFVASTHEEMRERCRAWLDAPAPPGAQPGKLTFVFPGQGSQWAGMGRHLLATEPVFAAVVARCARAFESMVEWSLLDMLESDDLGDRLESIEVVQPTLFAMQIGLSAMWQSWGVRPDAVVGHSMGEVAAAHVAGILSIDDAARVICRRSAHLRSKSGAGAMAVVDLPAAATERLIDDFGARVAVAAINGPRSTVISGDVAAIATVLERLERDGVFARRVKVDVASHSAQVEDLGGPLAADLAAIRPGRAQVPFHSTVTGRPEDGSACDARYWVRNLRDPVLFAPVISSLAASGHGVFLEISPHPVLLPSLDDIARDLGRSAWLLPSLRRDEDPRRTMLESLAMLYVGGRPVDFVQAFPKRDEPREPVPLPRYPWQRERFWVDAPRTQESATDVASATAFLGSPFESALDPGTSCWPVVLGGSHLTFLKDHQIDGAAIAPGAASIEMALEALGGQEPDWSLHDVRFERPIPLDIDASLQLTVSSEPSSRVVRIFSRPAAGSHAGDWVLHTRLVARRAEENAPAPVALDVVRERCRTHLSGTELYASLARRGLQYRGAFTSIADVWRGDGEALVRVVLPFATGSADRYVVHPALLDAACFQVLGALAGASAADDDLFLPTRVDTIDVTRSPGSPVWAHVRRENGADPDTMRCDVSVLDEAGRIVLTAAGVEARRVARVTTSRAPSWSDWAFDLEWRSSPALPSSAAANGKGRVIVVHDDGVLAAALEAALTARGVSVASVPGTADRAHLTRALQEASADGAPCRGVVYLPQPDRPDTSESADTMTTLALRDCLGALHAIQAVVHLGSRDAPRVWIVTRGLHAEVPSTNALVLAQAPLWGLGRVADQEHPDLRCTLVDLATGDASRDADALASEIVFDDDERQIVHRVGNRLVARLVRHAAPLSDPSAARVTGLAAGVPFRLQVREPGRLDSLHQTRLTRHAPSTGEVEIEVHAAGLNFLDVLSALDVRPDRHGGHALGCEVSGVVSRVGPGVQRARPGDAVMALVTGGLASHVIAREALVVRIPRHLAFDEAAGVPIAFVTATYALRRVARLERGERVLIHAAAGGTGLAAVQTARQIGAEIYATAGSDAKRAHLEAIGVQHVSDSRSAAFVDDVLRWSDGRGVDVVLNSLSGPLMESSLAVVAPYGRFVELGKRDIYQNGRLPLRPFSKSLSFTAVDVLGLAQERPSLLTTLLDEVVEDMEAGELAPLPRRTLSIDRAEDGFRLMAQAGHIGKIVFAFDRGHEPVDSDGAAVKQVQVPDGSSRGWHLVTGGLGRLGVRVAEWLAGRGATDIVLVGRSGPSDDVSRRIAAMAEKGVRVSTVAADVTRRDEIAGIIARQRQEGRRLEGLVHAAGVLDDRVLLRLDEDRLWRVMAPKVLGAWHLHDLTRDEPIEFFVLYSSAASLLGSPGQGNYAAGNAFLDALARFRRAQRLPALSINWGPFADEGLAASPERGGRLAVRGVASMRPDESLDVLSSLVGSDTTRACVMRFDLRRWREFYPGSAGSRLFEALGDQPEVTPDRPIMGARLMAADPIARRALLESEIREHIGRVSGVPTDRITAHTPFNALGLDSLMALELRNRLERTFGLRLPATLVWTFPDVERLARHLAEQIDVPVDDLVAPAATLPEDDLLARIQGLSDAAAEALLAERLDDRGRTS
jgi:acyl transferase domain-containing protein/acyl carrier protein